MSVSPYKFQEFLDEKFCYTAKYFRPAMERTGFFFYEFRFIRQNGSSLSPESPSPPYTNPGKPSQKATLFAFWSLLSCRIAFLFLKIPFQSENIVVHLNLNG